MTPTEPPPPPPPPSPPSPPLLEGFARAENLTSKIERLLLPLFLLLSKPIHPPMLYTPTPALVVLVLVVFAHSNEVDERGDRVVTAGSLDNTLIGASLEGSPRRI